MSGLSRWCGWLRQEAWRKLSWLTVLRTELEPEPASEAEILDLLGAVGPCLRCLGAMVLGMVVVTRDAVFRKQGGVPIPRHIQCPAERSVMGSHVSGCVVLPCPRVRRRRQGHHVVLRPNSWNADPSPMA